ncbi:hypothetical protein CYMTET_29432 [Cymbomonas tetramitiformis]|uniref:Uncharacterized protein n=1 Tax=Cymbomonas tetramitiformis TaxID=36881 RepID=A0AAE0FL80_9CHLO|nr:hypothetical protein CYMTET_29432 [Cymbomonas tetramitiformis]
MASCELLLLTEIGAPAECAVSAVATLFSLWDRQNTGHAAGHITGHPGREEVVFQLARGLLLADPTQASGPLASTSDAAPPTLPRSPLYPFRPHSIHKRAASMDWCTISKEL